MGTDKALLHVHGRPMAVGVADAMRAAGAAEVLAIGGDAPALAALGLDVRPDDWPGEGPLGATITALQLATCSLVLVVACDLLHPAPPAMAGTIGALAEHPGAVAAVPVEGGHRQWTHAAWRTEAVRALVGSFESGERSLQRAAAELLVFEVPGISARWLADADEPGDLPRPGYPPL
jgi:molybdopterin-guanine dinucleotide biosynthesis protein A